MCYTLRMEIVTIIKNWLYKRRLKRCGLSFPVQAKIHGVKGADRQGALAQSRNGDNLQIVHVPLPDYPFNVYVYSITLNRVLGYLDNTLAEQLVYLFKKDFCRDAALETLTGGPPTYKYFGAYIRIYETAVLFTDDSLAHLHGE